MTSVPMESLTQLDWRTIFIPTIPVAELFLRGTVIYLLSTEAESIERTH